MDHNTTDTIPELSIDELEAIALVDLLGADDPPGSGPRRGACNA